MTTDLNNIDKTTEKRILQFGAYPEDADLIKGGIESSVYGLCQELRKHDNTSIKVLTYPKREVKKDYKVVEENIEVVHFSNPFYFDALSSFCFFRIIKEIKAFKPTICHLHGTFSNVLVILLYLKMKGIKSVITVHGLLTVEQQNIYRRKKSFKTVFQLFFYTIIEFITLNLTKEIIVNTPYVSNWIRRQTFISSKLKINIIPQGIDDVFFSIPDLGSDSNLVSVGALSRRKGYEYSITAVKALTKKYPDIRYYIVGMLHDNLYFNELKSLITKLELEKNVFIYPDVNKIEVFKYLSNGYIFMLHSEEESQGIVFCEAMAAGKPIVATNVGGIPDVVKDNHNGFLSPYGNVPGFYSSLDTILSSTEIRNEMSKVNREDAREYLWSTVANKVLSIYQLN